MQRLITLCLLCAFGAVIVGCEAHAKVGDPAVSKPGDVKETTTVRSPNGDTKTETTIQRNN